MMSSWKDACVVGLCSAAWRGGAKHTELKCAFQEPKALWESGFGTHEDNSLPCCSPENSRS